MFTHFLDVICWNIKWSIYIYIYQKEDIIIFCLNVIYKSKKNKSILSTGFYFLFRNDELKMTILRHIVLINQPLVIVVSHKIIVHNLELIINNNTF